MRVMRKKVSLVLVIIMLTSILQSQLIFAASGASKVTNPYEFIQLDKGLGYIGGVIGQATLEKDEVALKWEMRQAGEYKLDYYLEIIEGILPVTYKLELEFYKHNEYTGTPGSIVPNQGQMGIRVRLFRVNSSGTLDPVNVVYSQYSGTNWIDYPIQDEYITTININDSATTADRTLGLKVGPYVHIKLLYNAGDETLTFSTDGIESGNVTPFSLYHEITGLTTSSPKVAEILVFKGLKDFRIAPTHLVNSGGKLESEEVIISAGIVPGSKPGVKVSFEKPKLIKGNTFEYINSLNNGTNQDHVKGILKLSEEFRGIGSGGNTSQLLVNFELFGGAKIRDGLTTTETKATVIEENNQLITYFAAENITEDVYLWDYLEDGMIITAALELTGGVFNEVNQPSYTPDNIGHTYIEYGASRIGFDDIAFNVKPYRINGPVTYKLQKTVDITNENSWQTLDTRYYDDIPDSETITLTTNNQTEAYYRILMETDGKEVGSKYTLKSQVIKYSPQLEPIPLAAPHIVGVENIYVVPSEDIDKDPSAQPQAIGFNLEWSAPQYEDLKELLKGDNKIYYELYLNTQSGKRTPIKVFEVQLVTNNGQEIIEVLPYVGTVGTPKQPVSEGKYDSRNNVFSINEVVLKKSGETKWENLRMPQGYLNKDKADYPGIRDIQVENELDYLIPGNYYLSMVAVYDTALGTSLSTSQESNLYSISLDNVHEIIPTPNQIQSQEVEIGTMIGTAISFNHVDLERYMEYMLRPIDLTLDNNSDRTYEIYLYQDDKITTSDLERMSNDPNYNGELSYDANGIQVDAEYLRQSKQAHLIKYVNGANEGNGIIKFTGLNPNQVYYMQVRVSISPKRADGSLLDTRYSMFSKVHSFTTGTKPLPPTPDEQVPPAPKDFTVKVENNTTAQIKWESGGDNLQIDHIYYELVRTQGNKLEEKYLDRAVTIEEILNKDTTYKGFHTKEDYVYTYMNGTWKQFGNFWSANQSFEDNTLAPNTLYYYYIRTVHVIDGEVVYSDWIMNPATTTPVDKPIKLQVESSKVYSYDTTDEVVISFWAPIPKDAKVPQEYDFEIAIRGDKDEDFKSDYTTRLVKMDTENVGENYRHFVYKISGLRPSTRYDIKVRVIDKTKPLETGMEYPKSLYSSQVTHRTEFDELEVDKENKFEEYLKKYDSEAEKLRRQPYWILNSTGNEAIFKYRPDYIHTELIQNPTYQLVTEDNVSKLYYYLPANMLNIASELQATLNLVLKDQEAFIRPYTLTQSHEDIKEAIKKLNSREIKDYYIGLEFGVYNRRDLVSGEKPVSPEIFINMELIYVNEQDRLIEDQIMDALNGIIEDYRLDVIKDLERELSRYNTIAEEKLNNIIQDTITEVQNDHEKEVSRIMKKNIGKSYEINELEKPFLITCRTEGYNINAYYKTVRNWESLYTFKSGSSYATEGNKLGTYIFTTRENSQSVIPGVPGASELIGKYQLTDFFMVDSYGLSKNATRSQVYGAVARIMGAKRGVDYPGYLKQRGIQGVMNSNTTETIRQDEAIYLIMQAYEKMYYRPINSIQITNRQSIQNIGAFQVHYRNYVYAALQLGIVQTTNNKIIPSQIMKAEDIIKMLSKIVPR